MPGGPRAEGCFPPLLLTEQFFLHKPYFGCSSGLQTSFPKSRFLPRLEFMAGAATGPICLPRFLVHHWGRSRNNKLEKRRPYQPSPPGLTPVVFHSDHLGTAPLCRVGVGGRGQDGQQLKAASSSFATHPFVRLLSSWP